MITLKDKIVKIRKEHRCFMCLRKFPIGTEMTYWVGIYDSTFCAGYNCVTCEKIINNGESSDDGYERGYVNNLLNRQTPEQYLEELWHNQY